MYWEQALSGTLIIERFNNTDKPTSSKMLGDKIILP